MHALCIFMTAHFDDGFDQSGLEAIISEHVKRNCHGTSREAAPQATLG